MVILISLIFDKLYRVIINRFIAFSMYKIIFYILYNREKSQGHSFGYSYITFDLFLTLDSLHVMSLAQVSYNYSRSYLERISVLIMMCL